MAYYLSSSTQYIHIGKIGSPYGIYGWIKVLTYTEFGANVLQYTPWYLTKDNLSWDTVEIETGRIYGKGVLVKLSHINTPEEARLLAGKKVAISRAQLPTLPANEYYWSDLEDLTVINQRGEILGKVIYLLETGSNDVLVVKGQIEQAIPYLPDVIIRVDLIKKEIHVNWEL